MRKASLTALLGDIAGTEEVLGRTRSKESHLAQEKASHQRSLQRAKAELYERIWSGESTGNVVNDIIIATKGILDAPASENLRALMARFAAHRGQFVARSHYDQSAVGRPILIGIISGDVPTLCWNPQQYERPYAQLPIVPAVSFDSTWPHGYKNLTASSWKIRIDREETGREGKRCWELERLLGKDSDDIHVGDEAVWKYICKSCTQQEFGPAVTLVRVASGLGRPLSSIPCLKKCIDPLLARTQETIGRFYGMRKIYEKAAAELGQCPSLFAKELDHRLQALMRTNDEILSTAEQFVRHASEPHMLKQKK